MFTEYYNLHPYLVVVENLKRDVFSLYPGNGVTNAVIDFYRAWVQGSSVYIMYTRLITITQFTNSAHYNNLFPHNVVTPVHVTVTYNLT